MQELQEAERSGVIAFGWYGGKYSHRKWLLPLLPKTNHYCEPFGGSAAILLNRDPSPVETYNDMDGEVVNFFRALREKKDELIEAIGLMPFSRQEFSEAIMFYDTPNQANVERARQFFIRARQVMVMDKVETNEGKPTPTLAEAKPGIGNELMRWLNKVQGLQEVVGRLLRVQIENDTPERVIKRYDSQKTLFYCDALNTKTYKGQNKQVAEHIAPTLQKVKGMAAVFCDDTPVIRDLFADWTIHTPPTDTEHPSAVALLTNY